MKIGVSQIKIGNIRRNQRSYKKQRISRRLKKIRRKRHSVLSVETWGRSETRRMKQESLKEKAESQQNVGENQEKARRKQNKARRNGNLSESQED